MIAHYTNGNVLTVKRLLGDKRIENTMKYTSMIHFKDDKFEVTTATSIEEAEKVLSAGFEYVIQKRAREIILQITTAFVKSMFWILCKLNETVEIFTCGRRFLRTEKFFYVCNII